MISKNEGRAKFRILIVDNDEQDVESLSELISFWGYVPVVAQGIGRSLMEDAISKAKDSKCHLALVDMRLLDDTDRNDMSGLDLVNDLKPARTIVLSAYGDQATARKGIREKGAVSFVGKAEDPLELENEIEAESIKLCAAVRNLNIAPPEVLSNAAQILFLSDSVSYQDQIADVLAQLFPRAMLLRLEKLGTESISSDFSTVPRPRSIVLKVYEGDRQPVVVKLARSHKIKIEVEKYKNFIDGHLKGNYKPIMQETAILWDIGGAIYSYIGDFNVRPFYRYFETESIEKIEKGLRSFYKELWSDLYSKKTEQRDVSLFNLYCSVWDRDWYDKRVVNFKCPDPAQLMGKDRWEKIQSPDPIEWLKQRVGENLQQDASRTEKTFTAVTHGDLHGDNLLVDENQNVWVIDFERSGEGHSLQDFIELESDIINRLASSTLNAATFVKLCLAIARPKEIGELSFEPAIAPGDQMQKLFFTISTLRSLAVECTGISDARQYLFGLLFNALFRATLISAGNHEQSQQRALMLASILCHRLEHWGEPWPPAEWNAAVT